jgi:transposase
VAEARKAHIADQPAMDTSRLVFIDETGVASNMIRRYGRAPKGKRLVDKTPHGHWKITTCVAALTASGIAAPATIDGAMNGELFLAWVVQILIPALKPGDIVIWDNLPCHKNNPARAAIEAAGASIRPLPAYSPDLNPIEKAFAKLKALLRKARPRTKRAINRCIAKIFTAFTPEECLNYFRSCGYSN